MKISKTHHKTKTGVIKKNPSRAKIYYDKRSNRAVLERAVGKSFSSISELKKHIGAKGLEKWVNDDPNFKEIDKRLDGEFEDYEAFSIWYKMRNGKLLVTEVGLD